MELNEAVKIRDDANATINRINSKITHLESSRKPLTTELERLECRFPGMLAAFHTGTLTEQELDEARSRMQEIRRELSEIPLAIPALRALIKPANEMRSTALDTIHAHERLQRYLVLRDQIIERGEISGNEESELRLLAAYARRGNEAERLLHELPYHAQKKRANPDAVFIFTTD